MRTSKFIFHQYSKLMHFYYHQVRASSYQKKYSEQFKDIDSFVLFLGYPRSGHTLLGSMLDAHPDMLIAHEYHALQKQDRHKTAEELFAHLIAQDKWFAARGQKWTGYSYKIPSGWQGKFRKLKVIGDKRGGASSRILFDKPERLDRLQQLVKVPIKIIIVHRNPFDNIATRARGGNYYQRNPDQETINREIIKHFRDVETIDKVKAGGKYTFIELTHEEFVMNPSEYLAKICQFIGVKPEKQFIETCIRATRHSSNPSRNKILWTDEQIHQINQQIARYDFLKDYTFDA